MSHAPRKRFGQHFLADRDVLERIAAAINPRPEEHLLEIGPGEGALTRLMIGRAGQVTAIEIDRDLVAALRMRHSSSQLQLFEADALEFDYASLPAGLRVAGNLPYNISTPLLFRLCEHAERFVDMHFMLQKEVVERMAAGPSTPAYGRLSVMLQHWFEVEHLFDVGPEAFRPPPKVQSSVVRLTPRSAAARGDVDPVSLRRVVTAAFSHRRKTLGNALTGVVPRERLAGLGIDPGRRAENLSLAEYVMLASALGAA